MRKYFIMLLLLFIAVGVVACKSKTASDEVSTVSETVYLANTDMNGLVPVSIDLNGKTIEEKVTSIIDILKAGDDNTEPTIPSDISVLDIKVNDNNVVLSFNESYNNLSSVEEIICRSSIVKSVTELTSVNTVEFYIGSVPYKSSDGLVIGAMGHDDVILDLSNQGVNSNTKVVTLYFADAETSYLVPVELEIELNSDEQIEKTVINKLIEGPTDENLVRTIPEETKIKNVYTNNGICYVDLSEEFVTKHTGGSTGEGLTIYSIVNTLTDLPNISKVQFLIEGSVREEFKGHYQFNLLFQKNWDIVQK